MKSNSTLKRKSRLRPVSKKRQREMKEYSRLRKEFLSTRRICQVWLRENGWSQDPVCGLYDKGPLCVNYKHLLAIGAPEATEVHHRLRRGKNYLNTDSWVAVCHANHMRIEGQSTYDNLPYGLKWARENNWLA